MTNIGYKKPPAHSRFKKGASGNPSGRPKGSKNTLKLLNEILEERIYVQQDGKPIKISKKIAMLMQLVNSAVKGDIKAISALFPFLLQIDLKEEEALQIKDVLSQNDQELINKYISSIQNKEIDHAE